MTLPTTVSRVSYPGTGSTGPFVFPFRVFAAADLLVTKRTALGVETTLAYVVDFTASGIADATGSITLITALAVGETLVIRRAPAFTQATSIRNQGPFLAATHEDAFDRFVMMLQSLKDMFDRSFKLDESYDPAAYDLSIPPGTVGQAIGWDDGGKLKNLNIGPSVQNISYPSAVGTNDILTQRNRNAPWDDMDAADGVLVQGRVTPSGHVWALEGAGAAAAYIDKGGYRAAGNTYATLTDTQIINEVEGTFSWTGPGLATSAGLTIMFSRGSSPGSASTLDKLLHMNFTHTGWHLLKSLGATNLVEMANAPAEVNYPTLPASIFGNWIGGPLRLDGTRYKIRMVVDLVANTITIYMPDGSVIAWQDNDISTVVGNRGVWQITGEAGGTAVGRWHHCALGPSKAANIPPSTSTRDAIKLSALYASIGNFTARTMPLVIPVTGNGWYTIAVQHPASGTVGKMGGYVTIWGEDLAGRKALCRVKVGTEASAQGTVTSDLAIFSVEKILGVWSGGWVTQVRLSQLNTAPGTIQLDVNVVSANSAGSKLFATFEGEFVPQASVVGAVALASWNIVLDIFPIVPTYKSEVLVDVPITGVGFYNVAKQIAAWQQAGNFSYMGGRIIVEVADNAGRRSAFEVSISHAQKTKVPVLTQLWAVGDWGGFPVTQVRCSTDDVGNLCNLDINYQGSIGGAKPPNFCRVTLIGFFVPQLAPVVGVAALATNSTVLALT